MNLKALTFELTTLDLSSTATRDLVIAATQMLTLEATGQPYMAIALNVQVGELESAILTTKILQSGYLYVCC